MKSQKLHSKSDIFLLGYTIPVVHSIMDAASKTLGSQHRQIDHIYPVVDAMGICFGSMGRNCAMLHLLLDMNIIDSKYIESKITNKRKIRHKKQEEAVVFLETKNDKMRLCPGIPGGPAPGEPNRTLRA